MPCRIGLGQLNHLIKDVLDGKATMKTLDAGTGAGVIFGATGGVMEAALRSAYYLIKAMPFRYLFYFCSVKDIFSNDII